jgi:GABA(A) receptor-associated protein
MTKLTDTIINKIKLVKGKKQTNKQGYRDLHTEEQRINESAKIKLKYPDRIPIIIEQLENSELPDIDKHRYLVPYDLTIGQFMYVIRKRIRLPQDMAIFIFTETHATPPAHALVCQVYKEYCASDGFLYLYFSGESTFG